MRAYLIGIGLILVAVHNPNQPFIQYVFLPQIGIALIAAGVLSIPFAQFRNAGLGSKWVYIPLLLVCAAISLSGLAQYGRGEISLMRGLAPLASSVMWFGLYLAARVEGEKIGKPIAIAVTIEAVSVVYSAFVSGGVRGGGLVSPTNYDIAVAVMVFGTFLSPQRWQWWLMAIAGVGIYYTGAEEGLVAIGVVALIILIRRHFHLKTLAPVIALGIAVAVSIPTGVFHNLYIGNQGLQTNNYANPSTANKVEAVAKAVEAVVNPPPPPEPQFSQYMDIATGYRFSTHWKIRPIQPFGYGYNLTEFYWGIPHNIALIIIEQVGLLGLMWFGASIYSWKISKRHYLWASVFALGIFDHYLWTQIAPWWWVMVGVSGDKV